MTFPLLSRPSKDEMEFVLVEDIRSVNKVYVFRILKEKIIKL